MAASRNLLTIVTAATITLFLFYQLAGRSSSETLTTAISALGASRNAYTGKRPVHKNLAPAMNDTLGFDKIFVLNLPERTDKRDFMTLASSFTKLDLTFRKGVKGAEVANKSLPDGHEERKMGETIIGSWRGHINIIREIVEKRMESALIMEDDVDWDMRIKEQMPSFASGVRNLLNQTDDTEARSPYGDGWDVLWMGRCNDAFTEEKNKGREVFVIDNDKTVPLLKHMSEADGQRMISQLGLGDNTRVVHRVEAPICTFAYAVSFRGAQKILYSMSVGGLAWNYDNALSWWCTDKLRAYNQECIGATPTYFYQHKVKSSVSKNSDNFEEQGRADESYTLSIRLSLKKNIQRLLMGRTDFVDTYPDVPSTAAPEVMPPAAPLAPFRRRKREEL